MTAKLRHESTISADMMKSSDSPLLDSYQMKEVIKEAMNLEKAMLQAIKVPDAFISNERAFLIAMCIGDT